MCLDYIDETFGNGHRAGQEGHAGLRAVRQADHPRSGRLLRGADARPRRRGGQRTGRGQRERHCHRRTVGRSTSMSSSTPPATTWISCPPSTFAAATARSWPTSGATARAPTAAGRCPGSPTCSSSSAPNYSPGHGAGANFSMEVLAHYIIECLQLMALRGATTMEVTQQAYEDYVAEIDDDDGRVRCGATRPMRTPTTARVRAGSWWPPRTGWSTLAPAPGAHRRGLHAAMSRIAGRQNSFGDRQQPRDRPGDRPAAGRRRRHRGGDRTAYAPSLSIRAGAASVHCRAPSTRPSP